MDHGSRATDHGSRLFHVKQLKRSVTHAHGSRIGKAYHPPGFIAHDYRTRFPQLFHVKQFGWITHHGSRKNLEEKRITDHVPILENIGEFRGIVRKYILLVVNSTIF